LGHLRDHQERPEGRVEHQEDPEDPEEHRVDPKADRVDRWGVHLEVREERLEVQGVNPL